jgi:hypothetical protein
MAILQLNPVGMQSTDEGYISSITFRSAGGSLTYTPDANNQIGVTGNAVSPQSATRLTGGQGAQLGGTMGTAIKLVTG